MNRLNCLRFILIATFMSVLAYGADDHIIDIVVDNSQNLNQTVTQNILPPALIINEPINKKYSCLWHFLEGDRQFLVISGRFAKAIAGMGMTAQLALAGCAASNLVSLEAEGEITKIQLGISVVNLFMARWYQYTEEARREVMLEKIRENSAG